MTSSDKRPTDEAPEDLGEPVAELAGMQWPAAADFGRRVQRRIERRRVAGELLELTWAAPIAVLVELLRLPFEILAGRGRHR